MKRSFIFILTAILITLSVLPICSAESVDATLKAAYNYDKDANIIKVEARFFDIKVEEGIITANYDIKYDPEALELVEFKTVFPEEWDKFLSDESVKDFSVKKEDGHISWVFVVVPVGQGAKNDNVLGIDLQFKPKATSETDINLNFNDIGTEILENGQTVSLEKISGNSVKISVDLSNPDEHEISGGYENTEANADNSKNVDDSTVGENDDATDDATNENTNNVLLYVIIGIGVVGLCVLAFVLFKSKKG